MTFQYEKLNVTAQIENFIDYVYLVTDIFPQDELYGLRSQIRRAAISILLNLAEGSARRSHADFARFITISMASLVEVHAAIKIASRRDYLKEKDLEKLQAEAEMIWMRLAALRKTQIN
ncbi:four helix bundle protein [Patescibacteria group bacterium]|nr:four helix bundle protein [Patescibacteria group bacterium]